MNIVCVFPVSGDNEKNIPDILKEFNEKIIKSLWTLGGENVQLRFAKDDYVYVKPNENIEKQQIPKGESILRCLIGCSPIPDCVIMCDGSGAIPYENIIQIFQELISDSRICCVMASRGKNKAISPERFLIEEFEVFLLQEHFRHDREILDGQCGLWAFRNGELKINGDKQEIKLTAKSYEIELDLLSEVLEKDLTYSFVPVELPPRTVPSSFTHKNNLIKISFLLNKYRKLRSYIPKYLEIFEDKKKDAIKKVEKSWEKYKGDLLNLL